MDTAPNAQRFAPLPAERAALWADFTSGRMVEFFPGYVGLRFEEV